MTRFGLLATLSVLAFSVVPTSRAAANPRVMTADPDTGSIRVLLKDNVPYRGFAGESSGDLLGITTTALHRIDTVNATESLLVDGLVSTYQIDLLDPDTALVTSIREGIYAIDLSLGSVTPFSTGGYFNDTDTPDNWAFDVEVSTLGRVFASTKSNLIEIDPSDGTQTLMATNGYIDLVSDALGNLYGLGLRGGNETVLYSIDRVTGAETEITRDSHFSSGLGQNLDVLSDGRLVVGYRTEAPSNNSRSAAAIVDPVSGDVSVFPTVGGSYRGLAVGSDDTIYLSLHPVPEPSTALLLASGLVGLGIPRRRRMRSRKSISAAATGH